MITRPSRITASAFVLVSLAAIAFVTLQPSEAVFSVPTFCIFCGPLGGVDFVLNTALFVPLGIALRWLTGRWTTSTLIGAAITLVIETLQWRFIPGRDASLGDLVANTMGTMGGAWLGETGLRWVNAGSSGARRLAAAFGVITSALLAVSAVLLQPAVPRWAQYVQWAPLRPNMDPFGGRLIAVDLNGRQVHATEALPSAWTVDTGTLGLSVRAIVEVPAPPTRRLAIIARTANDLEEGFLLGQRGDAAVFRTNMSATRFKLRSVLLGLPGGLLATNLTTDSATTVLTLTGNSNPRAIELRQETASGESRTVLRRTIGLAWTLLLPWDVAVGPRWWVANALWLGALVIPVTFLVLRSGSGILSDPERWVRWWPLALVLATIAVAPAVTGLSTSGPGEWFGLLAGAGAAILLERWTSDRSAPNFRAGASPETSSP